MELVLLCMKGKHTKQVRFFLPYIYIYFETMYSTENCNFVSEAQVERNLL